MHILSGYPLLLRRMKYLLLIVLLIIASCGNSGTSEPIEHFYAPATGTIIAADSMRITEDSLNELYYTVRITAGDSSVAGRYKMYAAHGYNEAESELVYPKLTQCLKPAIRRDETMPYSYIIGFKYNDDDTFRDYARVSANRIPGLQTQIELRYLKAYYVDTAK